MSRQTVNMYNSVSLFGCTDRGAKRGTVCNEMIFPFYLSSGDSDSKEKLLIQEKYLIRNNFYLSTGRSDSENLLIQEKCFESRKYLKSTLCW